MSEKVRNKIIESREKAIVDFAYNINKVGFIHKLVDVYPNYSVNNKIRVISHILSNNFKSGVYLTEDFIKEKGYKLKENSYGFIYEYLKVIDEEIGRKEYKFIIKYNIDQLEDEYIEEAKKEILKEYEEKQTNILHCLIPNKLEKHFEEKQYDDLEKNIFLALLNLEKGKSLDLFYRFNEEDKKVLIDYTKEYSEEIRTMFYEINVDLIKYLEENKIKEKDSKDE